MGTGTFVNPPYMPDPPSPAVSRWGAARGFDMPLLAIVIALVVFGLVMLFSASWDFSLGAFDSPTYMFSRQLLWLGLGLVAALILSFLDYHHWHKLIVPAMRAAT